MSIKTAAERLREKYPSNTDHDDLLIDYVEFIEFQRAETAELRAAYEAQRNEVERLQKELAQAKEESQNYENAVRIVQEWNGQMMLANGELRVTNAELKAEIRMARDTNEISSLANKKFIEESTAQAKRIAELEKCIEILQRPLDDQIISRIVCLVKNIPDEELASNVFESVRNMTNWNKSTPTEFLVLFDKTAASKNGE